MVMSLIESLTRIKNAVYGREVREAIHDGVFRANQIADGADAKADKTQIRQDAVEDQFDAVQRTATETTDWGAEIVVASDGETTLQHRLDRDNQLIIDRVEELGINVASLGAKGDGETDDTLAFQNALNKGTKIIGDRDKTYFITQPLNVIFDNTEVDLRGAKIIYSHNQNAPHSEGRTGRINDVGIFNVKGETSASPHNIDTASDFRLDLGRVTLLDYGEFEAGDVVELVVTTGNNNANTLTPNVNVLTKITETEGNVIKFDYFVPRETWDYSDYQIIHASVTKVNPLKNVVIKNFTAYDKTPLRNGFISGTITQYPEADSHYAVGGIAVSRVENLRVENVSFNENMYNALHALYVYNSSFSNIECYNPRLLAGGEGYLIQLMNYHKVWVDNLRASGVRHILDFTGGAYAKAKDIFSYHSKQVPLTFHGAYDHNIEIDGLQGRTSGDGDRISISYGAGYDFGNAISDITFKNSYLLLQYNCDRSEKFAKNITFEGCNVQLARAPLQTIFNNCTVYMLRDTGDSHANKRGSDVDSYLRFDNCEIINGHAEGEGVKQYMVERFDAVDINNSIIRDDFSRDDVRTTSFPVKNIKSFNVNNCRLYIPVRLYGNGTSGYANTQYRFNNNEFHATRLGGVSLETIDGVPTTVVINANTFSPREAEGLSIRLHTAASWAVPVKLMITNNVAHVPFGEGADLNSNTNIEYVVANNIGLDGL